MKLTDQSAKDYVLQHLCDCGYEDVVIIKVIDHLEYGTCMKRVIFTKRDDLGQDSDYQWAFDVWVNEDNKIYGEW